MRRLLTVLLLVLAGTLRAEAPPLLQAAFQKLLDNEDHWAFTLTSRNFDKKGRPVGGEYVERYDPSQPYGRRWQLCVYKGRAPTESEITSWIREREKYVKKRTQRSWLDKLDLDHVTVANETGASITYLVPLRKGASHRFPADKVEVFLTVDKQEKALTGFSIQPRQPFRVAGVLKLESGRIDGRLDVIDNHYAPALTWVRGDGHLKLLGLFKIGLGAEETYSDFRRVKPYDDRFQVKIGDIKALDF